MKYLSKKVVKINIKLVKIIMLISVLFSSLQTPIYVFASELSSTETNVTPEKGDIRLGENGEISETGSVSITTTSSDGKVNVTKTVTKENSTGKYKVEFLISGQGETTTTDKPSYTVFVLDASKSMTCNAPSGNNGSGCNSISNGTPWSNAVSAAISFSSGVVNEGPNHQIALVTFNNTGYQKRDFANTAFTTSNFGSTSSGTNYNAGLEKAYAYLNGLPESTRQESTLNIIFISDGNPNSTSYSETLSKLESLNVNIYTFAYNLDKTTDKEAYDTLYEISTDNNVTSVSSTDIDSILKLFIETVTDTKSPGTTESFTDGIGKNFKIVTENNEEVSGYGVSYVYNTQTEITNEGTKLTFYIQINQDSPTGWYDTNDGYTLSYIDTNGESQTINCEENPQVYWVQNQYDYIVNYYKDSITESNLLISETRKAPANTIINESNVEKDKYLNLAGNTYEYDSLTPSSITITNDGTTKVINVLYVKAYGTLKVNYIDTDGNILLPSITTTKEKNTSYQTESKTIYGYTLKEVKGNENGVYIANKTIEVTYVYTKNDGNVDNNEVLKTQINEIIGVNSTFNYILTYKGKVNNYLGTATITLEDTLPYDVLTIEYPEGCLYDETTRKLTCTKTVELNENNQTIEAKFNIKVTYNNLTSLTNLNVLNKVTSTLTFGETEVNDESEVTDVVLSGKVIAEYVDESNKKLSDSESTTGLIDTDYQTNKKEIYGYTLKQIIGNEEGKYTKEDITVTYVYTKNDGNTETNEVTKTGKENIRSVNDVFNYTLTYRGKITDYVGNATLTLKDILPYEIDEELSTYDDRCTYKNQVLTCIETYEIDEENQEINEEFELSLVFKNIDSEKVTNKVESTLEYGNTTEKDKDETETEVFKGTVIATYKNKQGEILSENIIQEGLAGTNYETIALEFLGYTLITLPENQNGKYIANTTIYVDYIYDKNVGTSEEELEKVGPQKITDINKPFEYNIKYNLEIFDYVGEVKITLTDHLPYEIDEEKSLIGNTCQYTNGKIVCEYLKNITNIENSKIRIEENLILYYKNVISTEVINKVDAKVVYGDEEKTNNDEFTTEIPYGTLKVKYITEDGKSLAQPIISTNLVGTEYNTEQKSFNNYYLKEVIGETSGIYAETEKEVVYIYSLVPLPPQTGLETNMIKYIDLLIFITFVMFFKKKYI